MAELATIARPYAEALFKSVTESGANGPFLADQLGMLGQVAGDDAMRQFADNPKVSADQVYGVVSGVANIVLDPKVANLLQLVIQNGRLGALGEVAAQFKALVNAQSGTSDALIESAFPIDAAALSDVVATLERRFGRKLSPQVVVQPDLIGGIRVVVGDQVLDTSVKARLEHMKAALTA